MEDNISETKAEYRGSIVGENKEGCNITLFHLVSLSRSVWKFPKFRWILRFILLYQKGRSFTTIPFIQKKVCTRCTG